MSTQVKFRRGTAAEHTTFTGAVGEVTVDTTDDRLVVHDGSTAGGIPAAKESEIPSSATDEAAGIVELATTGEAQSASSTTLAVTPAGLAHLLPATLTEALSSDHTASGLKVDLTAGESLAFGNVCYVKSDGKAWKADADAASTMPVTLMCADSSISGSASGAFLVLGFARDDSWAWTVGGVIYASTSPGGLTQTAPSGSGDQVQVVGVATHADRIMFTPSLATAEVD